jgi:hypothetical protein
MREMGENAKQDKIHATRASLKSKQVRRKKGKKIA